MSEIGHGGKEIVERILDPKGAAGLADMCEEMLAGLKVIRAFANDAQKDKILKLFPTAKFDSATTRSIELLSRDVKDKMFDLIVKKKAVDVMDDFLKQQG